MIRLSLSKISCLLLVLILSCATFALAGTINIEAIKADLKPVESVLVMPLEGEWLIDVDASHGVFPGDLFSVIETGRPILHPATNAILGYLEKTRSVLKITKVKSGYSYATVVKQDGELKPGLVVRRFSGLTARMQDSVGDGQVFYGELQAALPHLDWLGYLSEGQAEGAPKADLVFRYDAAGLTVVGSDNVPMHSYRPQSYAAPGVQYGSPAGTVFSESAQAGGGIVTAMRERILGPGKAIVRNQATTQDGIWRSPPFRGTALGVAVADLDGDEKLEIAVLMDASIEIVRLAGGEYKQLARYEVPTALKALTLDAADLDKNGRAELFLTTARGHQVSSMVLELTGQNLKEVKTEIPYYFRSADLAGEGKVLVGQRYGNYSQPYAGPVFRVVRQGDDITAGAALALPKNTNVYSFVLMDNGLVARIKQQELAVSDQGGDLWDGDAANGASEIYIDFLDNDSRGKAEKLPYFIPPRLVDGENGVVLATEHKAGLFSNRFQTFGQGRVAAYQWDGTSMQELWHTRPQAGYLADFRYADADNDGVKEIVGFFTFGRDGILDFAKGRSALMVFELN